MPVSVINPNPTIDVPSDLEVTVAQSLIEDIGSGDINALLIDPEQRVTATLISREPAVICGQPWVDAVYRQLGDQVTVHWQVQEGETVCANTCLARLEGLARPLLTGERCALNWLQTLSGTATTVAHYVQVLVRAVQRERLMAGSFGMDSVPRGLRDASEHGVEQRVISTQSAAPLQSPVVLLDTRKTIPGLRLAQKYAVRIGGGANHRMGLYDAFLIKENHIASCGSLREAVTRARQVAPDKVIEVEVETLTQLEEAIEAKATIIMLDNFTLDEVQAAVAINQGRAYLEVSGLVSEDQLSALANTGIDYISMGALTKHIQAIDLSLRVAQ